MNRLFLVLFLLICGLSIKAQIMPASPKPSTLSTPQIITPTTKPDDFLKNIQQTPTQKQNQIIIRQTETQLKSSSNAAINEFYKTFQPPNSIIQYQLPELSSINSTSYFYSAFTQIKSMLSGQSPLSIKKAVFIVENAFFEEKMKYEQFDATIKQSVSFCNQMLTQNEDHQPNNIDKNNAIFSYITDTTQVTSFKENEKTTTHYPIFYDFNDYMGKENWSNMFVTKMLATNTGQCHSLPLFYLIMAEELEAEAYLAYSPNHSYIKFKSKTGGWYNAELTSGSIISDAAIMESGYIKSQAIKSGLYLDTISKHEAVTCLLNTLAIGYTKKYGYDSFIEQCSNEVLKYYPNQLNALMLKANHQTQTLKYIASQKKFPPKAELIQDPKAKIEFDKMHLYYAAIDKLGFENMPEEHYIRWLKSLEKAKKEAEQKRTNIHQITQ